MFWVPYPVFRRAPLVGGLDMDYWCSASGTKGAHVNTGYGTPNMFLVIQNISQKNSPSNFLGSYLTIQLKSLENNLSQPNLTILLQYLLKIASQPM